MSVRLFALAVLVLANPPPAGAKRPAYTTRPAPVRDVVRFDATYRGSGTFATTYRAEPPNPGGDPDHNAASDSSVQRWSLTYRQPITVPRCAPAGRAAADPCRRVQGAALVTGTTAVTGHIDHRHRDGLFSGQDQSIKCSLHATAGRETKLRTVLRLRYSHARHRVAVSVFSPMTVALIRLPGACPGQGDSLDGLYDNYVTPGFSFSRGYGSARWFRSATVVIPAGVFRRSSRIWIPFRQTRQGTPPGDCAVPFPAYEQCRAAGSWSGLLTLTARP